MIPLLSYCNYLHYKETVLMLFDFSIDFGNIPSVVFFPLHFINYHTNMYVNTKLTDRGVLGFLFQGERFCYLDPG